MRLTFTKRSRTHDERGSSGSAGVRRRMPVRNKASLCTTWFIMRSKLRFCTKGFSGLSPTASRHLRDLRRGIPNGEERTGRIAGGNMGRARADRGLACDV